MLVLTQEVLFSGPQGSFTRLPAQSVSLWLSDDTLVGICDVLCREQDISNRIDDISNIANSNFTLVQFSINFHAIKIQVF